ncbi:hypothetical protein A9Q84_05940 [Halobacteriovorax marinus]|uniref:Phosphatidylserine decarboxylase n=1 Tax=Halobacteriovorax marinus TaxID=97084 RepID=A0A1Y5FH04_9BACT|nr:hypothetical protein A9Q84_05940 [Halobacteriovorax marinus]
MGLTYLPRWTFVAFIFSAIALFALVGIFGLISSILIYSIFLIIFRRVRKDLREDSNSSAGVIFSPVNGRVVKIVKNTEHSFFGKSYTSILIQVPFWKGLGLFFPVTSEIQDVKTSFESCPDHLVKFKLASGLEVGFSVGLNILRLVPQIVVLPGDRGKQKMNFGYLPFGGSVKVYIPSSLEVLINENDEVVAGQGILAGIPSDIEENLI